MVTESHFMLKHTTFEYIFYTILLVFYVFFYHFFCYCSYCSTKISSRPHMLSPKLLPYTTPLAFSLNFFLLYTALFVLLTRMVVHLSTSVHDLAVYSLLLLLSLLHCILASVALVILKQFFLLVSFFYILLSILYGIVCHTGCGLLFAFVSPSFILYFYFLSSPRRIYVAKANGYYPPVPSILYFL